jgi:hypothetical protein
MSKLFALVLRQEAILPMIRDLFGQIGRDRQASAIRLGAYIQKRSSNETNEVLGTVAAHPDADGIIYDPFSGQRCFGIQCLRIARQQ